MGTYSAWEPTATLRLLGGARGALAPTRGGEGRGHIVSPRAQLVEYANSAAHTKTCIHRNEKKIAYAYAMAARPNRE